MMAALTRPRTINDLRALLAAHPAGTIDGTVHLAGLADDSRAVEHGTVFFARRGSQEDGAGYIHDARARGAAVIVTDRAPSDDTPALVVEDVAVALRRAADAWYDAPQEALALVGITGTKGKTTSAALTAAALRACGRTPATFGTIDHDLGAGEREPSINTTPGALALRRLLRRAKDNGCDTAVLEVSSHALDQGRTIGLPWSVGAFTNLASDHLDYHRDPQAYFEAKARLFSGLGPRATAVLNREDASWSRFAARVQGSVLTYGFSAEADLRAADVQLASDGTAFRLIVAGEGERDVRAPMVGMHNVLNILAALGCCVGLGLDPMVAADGAAAVTLVPGRLERIDQAGADVQAFVDYAHTEDALRQVLVFLDTVGARPITCVIGCGGDRDRSKRPRMARVAVEMADRAIFTSDNPRTEDPAAILADMTAGLSSEERARVDVIPDRARAIAQAVREAPAGATVLVAGKGHETYQILGTQKHPFDDAAELRGALALRADGDSEGSDAWGASRA